LHRGRDVRYNSANVDTLNPDELKTLMAAISKSDRLVEDLEKQQARLIQFPPSISPDQLEQGKIALENALVSARRMRDSFKSALSAASPGN
jgi:hypothetical protein